MVTINHFINVLMLDRFTTISAGGSFKKRITIIIIIKNDLGSRVIMLDLA